MVPETTVQKPLHCWCLKGLIGVDYFAELVKLSGDHSKDREPAREYDSILVTKTQDFSRIPKKLKEGDEF